jgi:hypothetical protein
MMTFFNTKEKKTRIQSIAIESKQLKITPAQLTNIEVVRLIKDIKAHLPEQYKNRISRLSSSNTILVTGGLPLMSLVIDILVKHLDLDKDVGKFAKEQRAKLEIASIDSKLPPPAKSSPNPDPWVKNKKLNALMEAADKLIAEGLAYKSDSEKLRLLPDREIEVTILGNEIQLISDQLHAIVTEYTELQKQLATTFKDYTINLAHEFEARLNQKIKSNINKEKKHSSPFDLSSKKIHTQAEFKILECDIEPSQIIVMDLLIDRYIEKNPQDFLNRDNAYLLVLVSYLISEKILNDVPYDNTSVAIIGGLIPDADNPVNLKNALKLLKKLEVDFAKAMDFSFQVDPKEYLEYAAKYLTHQQQEAKNSGLFKQDEQTAAEKKSSIPDGKPPPSLIT